MYKLLYFLAFFGYLNALCYEVKYCYLFDNKPVAASETLLEVVLEDVLNMENNTSKEDFPDIMFDDYRILGLFLGLVPVVLYFSWLLRRFLIINEQVKHTIYYIRRLILPGYYTFLYRYRPF